MRQFTLDNLVYNMRAERKIVLESYSNILSLGNISSMHKKPINAEKLVSEDSQGSLVPVSGRTRAQEAEVSERPTRRRYPAEYKLRILNEIDSAKPGGIGEIIRREGLYSSTVAVWRRQRNNGELAGLSPKKRGPKSSGPDPKDRQIKELERENRKLQRKLSRAHLLLDIQKKISEITGIPLLEEPTEEENL